MDDAQDLLLAFFLEALAGGVARHGFVLAEEAGHAVVLVLAHAGVEAHHGDAVINGVAGCWADGLGVRHGHGDAVHTGVHGRAHQVRLVGGLRVGGVAQLDVVFLGCVLGALAHEVPVGIAWCAVGDHGDDVARGVYAAGGVFGVFCSRGAACRRAPGEHRRSHQRCGNECFPCLEHYKSVIQSTLFVKVMGSVTGSAAGRLRTLRR